MVSRLNSRIIFLLFLLLTFIILFANSSSAQYIAPNENVATGPADGLRTDTVSYVSDDPSYTFILRPGIRFSDDRVIGYYDLLTPLYVSDDSILFFNPRFSHDDRDGYEWNLGLGYRHMLVNDSLILGANAYWDWRKSSTGETYQQLGLGLEAMAEPFGIGLTARINGYISLSDEEILDTWEEWYVTPTSIEYSLAYNVEEPLSGLDYEVGLRIPYVSDYVETWAYMGGYHYFSDYVDDINGFVARVEIIPTDFIKANYEYRYDNFDKSEHYGEVVVEVPFSIENLIAGKNPFEEIGSRIGGSRTLDERLYDQVHRDVDIITKAITVNRANHLDKVLPGNPATFILDITFVTPTGTGVGTLTDPSNLAAAVAVNSKNIFLLGGDYPAFTVDPVAAGTTLWGKYILPSGIAKVFPGSPCFIDTLTINASDVSALGIEFDLTGPGADLAAIELKSVEGVTLSYNRISVTNSVAWTYGIYYRETGSIGSATKPINVTKNTIVIDSTSNAAFGIGAWCSGTSYAYFNIHGNSITAGGTEDIYGIYGYANADIVYNVTSNRFSITSGNESYILTLNSENGRIGYAGNPTTFIKNSGTISGPNSHLLWLEADDFSNSSVMMGSGSPGMGKNTISLTSGSWVGNYPAAGGPVWENNGNFNYINP